MTYRKGLRVRHEDGRVGVLVKRNASYREWLVDVGGESQWWNDRDLTEDRDVMNLPAYDDPDAPTLGEAIMRAEYARDTREDR